MPQINKPSQKKLKRDGFKMVLERKYTGSHTFVQAVDKKWFTDHSEDYLTHSRVYRIYENENKVLIYIGG